MMRYRFPLAAIITLGISAGTLAQDRMTPELLWQLRRVSPPAVSPDGAQFVYGIREYDIQQNRGNTDLYIMSVAGGTPRRLTNTPGSEFNYVWRPDGERIGFLSSQSGSTQLWETNPDGSDLRQVTDIAGGIDNFSYAPGGDYVSFTRDVKLDETVNDLHGDLVSEPRQGMTDQLYRRIIAGRYVARAGGVTRPRVYAGWAALTGSSSATMEEFTGAVRLVAPVDFTPSDVWLSRAGAVVRDLMGGGYQATALVVTSTTSRFGDIATPWGVGRWAYQLRVQGAS
jgi:dipeptidyl aminopeptidase/acylaminoacyl peptidase